MNLSYLFGLHKEKPDAAAAACAKQPVPEPPLCAGVPRGWQTVD